MHSFLNFFPGLTLHVFPVDVSQVARAWNDIRIKINKRCRFFKIKNNHVDNSQEPGNVNFNTSQSSGIIAIE